MHEIGIDVDWFDGKSHSDLTTWLKCLAKPAAVFVAWDNRVQYVLRSCRSAKIRIPRQLVILDVDDDELICTLSSPEISSIRPDTEKAGFLAARLLGKMMRGDKRIRSTNVLVQPLGIIERASTHPPVPATVLIDEAMSFIRSNAPKGITPGDVAKHLRCSRRLLYLRFSELCGTTIAKKITRVKFEKEREVLRGSSRSITAIAHDCGFVSPGALENLFKRTYGTSMRDYRNASRHVRQA